VASLGVPACFDDLVLELRHSQPDSPQ
jgi:hypothetical protein